MRSPLDAGRLRSEEFPWADDSGVIYLNAASTGPLPERTLRATEAFNRKRATPQLLTFDEQFGAVAASRSGIARLIGASEREIAVAVNTSSGINLAAWGLPLGRGDLVIAPALEYPANVYPWHTAAKARGFLLHTVPARDGRLDDDALLDALDLPGARVLTLSWVGFATGVVADLDRLGTACRKRDIYLVVDGIQGVGALELDVSRTPIDILACGGQKWLLSPWGSGFTYVRREILEQITPQPVSWMAVRGSDDFSRLLDYDFAWRDDARRFEQVTLPYQDFAGMAESLGLLHEIGPAELVRMIALRTRALLDGAADQGLELVTPRERHAGIASIRPRDASATSARLDAASVVHSVREGTIRLSPHCYTAEEDVARALEALTP